MPLFEYLCSDCNKSFAQLVGMTADSSEPACTKCGGRNVTKLVSRFARVRSEDDVLDSLETAMASGNMDDPRSVSKLMREMGKEMDDEGGEDFEECLEEAEREYCDGDGGGED